MEACNTFQLITDGSCDLGKERAKEIGVEVVPFYVSMDGEYYKKEIEEISVRDFYQDMVDHPKTFPKTSLPSIEDYVECFEKIINTKTKNIICICITTKFSGSYNSAMNAKEIILETYNDAKITVVDGTVNTVLQGLLVLEAVKMQKKGYSYEAVLLGIDRIKSSGRIFFTIGSVDYLVHGGRVGKLMGIATGTLGIKPLILLKEGEIFPNGISRGRKSSKKKLIEQVCSHLQKDCKNLKDYIVVVGYGYDYKEAEEFRNQVTEELIKIGYHDNVDIFQIGATIGVHTGPHPLGCGILKRYDS